MKFAFDDSRIFSPMFTTVIKIGGNILESSETKLMNSPTYVFNVDHVAKMRSELSYIILDKKLKLTFKCYLDQIGNVVAIIFRCFTQPLNELTFSLGLFENVLALESSFNSGPFMWFISDSSLEALESYQTRMIVVKQTN